MSMHKIPLTDYEREGLELHRLTIGKPSQLSDVFRLGMAWEAKRQKVQDIQRLCCETLEVLHEMSEEELSIFIANNSAVCDIITRKFGETDERR